MTLADMIRKLEAEYLDVTGSAHSTSELQERRGWNLRNRALLFDLKARQLEAGLVELEQNAPVDTRLRDQMIKFDLGGEG